MKHKVKATYVVCESIEVEIEIPDGLTEDEQIALVNKTLEERIDSDAGELEWDWVGDAPKTALGHYGQPEPPEEAWITIGEHRWATDGWVMIREDAPRPGAVNRWMTEGEGVGQVTADNIRSMLSGLNSAPLGDQSLLFRPHVGDILRDGSATMRVYPEGVHCAVVERDGEVIAVVMPLRFATSGAVGINGES